MKCVFHIHVYTAMTTLTPQLFFRIPAFLFSHCLSPSLKTTIIIQMQNFDTHYIK